MGFIEHSFFVFFFLNSFSPLVTNEPQSQTFHHLRASIVGIKVQFQTGFEHEFDQGASRDVYIRILS